MVILIRISQRMPDEIEIMKFFKLHLTWKSLISPLPSVVYLIAEDRDSSTEISSA